jgi:glycosyltransferase involved in cell wall biosynthesis
MGGTQLLFKSISEKLHHNYGDEVTVVTTNSLYDPGSIAFEELKPSEKISGIDVQRFSFNRRKQKVLRLVKKVFVKAGFSIPASLNQLMRVPYSKKMKSYIDNCHADVVCASSAHYLYMDYATYRMKLDNPKPFVFMGALHFDDDSKTDIPDWVIENIKQADLYIANTAYEKSRLVMLGIPKENIRVVGCGVDIAGYQLFNKLKSRTDLNLPQDAHVIGYVGRFAASKDVILLIDAFSELNLNNTYLLLAGASNSYLDIIKKHIKKIPAPISQRIIFKLDFTEEEKLSLFAAMDLFVSPSYSESFGIVFLEAWASKLSVIGANIGAIASVIEHQKDGLLFEPKNKESLKQAIHTYILDDELRHKHANNGLQKVMNQYTWNIIASKYREIYEEAIEIFNKKCADL